MQTLTNLSIHVEEALRFVVLTKNYTSSVVRPLILLNNIYYLEKDIKQRVYPLLLSGPCFVLAIINAVDFTHEINIIRRNIFHATFQYILFF